MVSMRQVRRSRSVTKALHNSIANTGASSASLRCETFEGFFLRVLRKSNWSVASECNSSSPLPRAASFPARVIELAHTPCGPLSQWSATEAALLLRFVIRPEPSSIAASRRIEAILGHDLHLWKVSQLFPGLDQFNPVPKRIRDVATPPLQGCWHPR